MHSARDEEIGFVEMEVGGEMFCLVPKELSSYVPSSQIEIQYLEGVGPVEVADNFAYINSNLFLKIRQIMEQNVDLHEEVSRCRSLLWSQYGKGGDIPPFEPAIMKEIYTTAGATKLFPTIMAAMTSPQHTTNKRLLNEKKNVAILYMMMFGQFQKACWFQRVLSSQVVNKGLSETGLGILHKSGIAISKSAQRLDLYKTTENMKPLCLLLLKRL